jgi:putative ABC transport system permease protein
MKLNDLFEETYLALLKNKARTGLTMLGIVIGISSVIAMISIGQGTQSSIESSIESIGSNLLMITPGVQKGVGMSVSGGRGSAQTLTKADAEAIADEISSAEVVAPDTTKSYQITSKGTNTNTQVVGTVPEYSTVRNVEIETGTFITKSNVNSNAKVAVLGPTTVEDLFGTDINPIGQSIRINKIQFKVIGITKSKGGSGFSNQDDKIYIPITTAQRFLSGDKYVSTISVQVESQELMASTESQITTLLLRQHSISATGTADFSVMNQADIVATASSVTGIFTILLASIAGISLLVGGIGIMNMMLTTVTERTREIGLRKAVGGKSKDISMQFLAESVMLTFVGGVFGVILGWALAMAISKFGGITTKISLFSVIMAFGVSALIGIVFGYYPAKRASKLNPIEALRYE